MRDGRGSGLMVPVRLGLLGLPGRVSRVGRFGRVGQQRGEQRPQLAEHLRRIGSAGRGLAVTLAPPPRAGLLPGLLPGLPP